MNLPRWLTALVVSLLSRAVWADPGIEYNRDIRPVLAENCFKCHGPDSAARKADLRLDHRDVAVAARALVPGEPESSEAIRRIFAEDPDERMPPPSSRKDLTAAQKELLRRWVAAGAEYQPHWSFIPPARVEPPPVKQASWVRNVIDNFVLARLESAGLEPAPEADRRTLARRLSLDLTGLPPAPALVQAFLSDQSPDAYERLVDKLLESKHWGEHRARYWLDAARYADTHGLHFDNYREMWTYRDWVINAFNRNLPFDQFTTEQLAGDLLLDRTLEQQIASGFNRCNITTNEGGVIPEEYLVLYTRDRTETVSQVWLGLTANCSTCHDHKFDPLSQREFYEMTAFFNNTTQGAMDGNIKDTPPVVTVPRPEDRDRWEQLAGELSEARRRLEARRQEARPEFDRRLAGVSADALAGIVPSDGLRLYASLSEGDESVLRVTVNGEPRDVALTGSAAWDAGHVAAKALKTQPSGNVEVLDAGDFENDQAFACAAWIRIPKRGLTGAIVARMDDEQQYRGWDMWLENERIGMHVVHQWPDDALKVVANTPLDPGKWHHVCVTYDGSRRAASVKLFVDGQLRPARTQADSLKNTIRTAAPLKLAQRHTQSRLNDILVQDLRLYDRALGEAEVQQVASGTRARYLLAKPTSERSNAETEELLAGWLTTHDTVFGEFKAKVVEAERELAAIKARGTVAYVAEERTEPAMAHVLFRGEYDKRRDPVYPGTPAMLPPMPAELPRNRLGFARWLLLPEHPLTARVTVNRFWQEVFGTGLVRSAGDFGAAGELPSHPELLDYLAIEFRESGWEVKKFFKFLVMSATYRQSTAPTREKLEKDAQNRLLSRGPRFRLEGELIRDYALATSGLLVPKLGGPSVKPYQPDGVWEAVAMKESNTGQYRRDTGENLYRRSLYTFWKRHAPPASMEIFNAPNREFCTVRRERTNTPLQALVTLNDPQFIEAARHLAECAIREAGETIAARIDFIAQRLLCRPLRAEEIAVVCATLTDLLLHYASHPEDAESLLNVGESKPDPSLDPGTLAAWTMLTNEMMNLDEALSK